MNEVISFSSNFDLISIKNLSKVYSLNVKALDSVNLSIKKDDFTAVIGPSGAGKSTLLRCINRLVKPTSGKICFHGEDITHAGGSRLFRVRKKTGMIFQQFQLVKRISVLENVLVGRLRFNRGFFPYLSSIAGKFSKDEKTLAFECLKQVGIASHAFHRADTLSGGQQQRVAIARVLAQRPDVILADEPVASLDPKSSDVVMDLLLKIHEENKIPVIVNLHQLDIAKKYSKRIFALNQGKVVFEGKNHELNLDTVKKVYGYIPSELEFNKVSNQ